MKEGPSLTKLLIVDDEPLALVGMQSMLDWSSMAIECYTARNGVQALAFIREQRPEIVISDIKMPLMDGLELLKNTREEIGELPVFIMLTSFEEFQFARQALRLGAVEYLLKAELTAEILSEAVQRALEESMRLQRSSGNADVQASDFSNTLQVYRDKFFIRLYNNLLTDHEQVSEQLRILKLDILTQPFAVAYCEIKTDNHYDNYEQQLLLLQSTLRLIRETAGQQAIIHLTTLDIQHFCILFSCTEPFTRAKLLRILSDSCEMVLDYFNVRLRCALGPSAQNVFQSAASYSAARYKLMHDSFTAIQDVPSFVSENVSSLTVRSDELKAAFEEQDAEAMDRALEEIVDFLERHQTDQPSALEAASAILTMTYSLLPDGENTLNRIFSDWPLGYKSIYLQETLAGCCRWLQTLRKGLVMELSQNRQDYKERMVCDIQRYIRDNLDKKLTLNDVAKVFNISTSYLSRLFSSYCEGGFVEYVTEQKIAEAKWIMLHTDKKIYEISEALGYENAFYFSRVFKKVTGLSPRDFMHSM